MEVKTKTQESIKLTSTAEKKLVTIENFNRAETDLYFRSVVKDGGFGKFNHYRAVMPIERQTVIRANRDTLYSAAIFDLEAGPLTITLPDPGSRFMSLQVINEDHYTPLVAYKSGSYTFTREEIGTRYVLIAIRTLIDPSNPHDADEAHKLQDAIKIEQQNVGVFETPDWDLESQKKVRNALLVLGDSLPDSRNMFGKKEQVDPVRFLIGSAMAWGGNPEKEATYINVTPNKNDGKTIHQLTVKDVPVDGFWSISVYNEQGYFEANDANIYSINNLTAKKNADGSITIQFGGCDSNTVNCIPITRGWNYLVRLYRPRPEIVNGEWKFPEAKPI